ncbi:protein HEAT-INDUCED TAS1 TARGET 4 [Eutrema salsugineum]|nr:protein HEAT-INDUCED TAS1 TARGET 4 [Eutrema salsugineum]
MSRGCLHPLCIQKMNAQEDYDASERAALVAAYLISSARVIIELDSEFTKYSAQFLVDYAGPKNESEQGEADQQSGLMTLDECIEYLEYIVRLEEEPGQGEANQQRPELTVKDCLECAFKKGMPKAEHWGHVGCVFKVPKFAAAIPRVPMKGQVIEAKTFEDAFKLLVKQPVGAKLHVFSPEIELVGEDGVYEGPSVAGTRYLGLRDVIWIAVEEKVATVRICYKKETLDVKVSLDRMLLALPGDGDGEETQLTEPTGLLVDFIVPRLSK